MTELLETTEEYELQIKKCYLPFAIEVQCPYCEVNNNKDFCDDYLSYPVTSVKEEIYVCCKECEEEFYFDVTLKLSLEVDNKTRKGG